MELKEKIDMLAKAILTDENANVLEQAETIKGFFEKISNIVEDMTIHTFKFNDMVIENKNQSESLVTLTMLLSDEKEYTFKFNLEVNKENVNQLYIKNVSLYRVKKLYKEISLNDIESMLDYIILEKKDIGSLYDRKLVMREWLKLNEYDPFNTIVFDPNGKIISFENNDSHTAYTIKSIKIPSIDKEVELLIRQCNGRLKGYRFY